MDELDLFFRFGVALVIGVLIGLQREHAFDDPETKVFGGVRTFALISLIGAAAALSADILESAWAFVGIAAVVGAFLSISYYVDAMKGAVGLTTEVSAVVAFLVGALAYWEQVLLAVAIGVITTGLLSIKFETQQFVARLTREDIYAVLKFAIITAIILPILPNEEFGPEPFNIFNPFTIWLLVVLISGLNFIGYVLVKAIGPEKGIGLTGLVGGLASSTAVTLTFTQRSKENFELSKPFALAIIAAWTVMFSRLLVEVAAVNPRLLSLLWLPVAVSMLAGLLYSAYLYFAQRQAEEEEVKFSNPFEISPAIKFGLLFVVVLLFTRAAQVYFGDTGIYVSSIISGFAGVDAIALSMAELSLESGGLAADVAVRAIILAAVSNTFIKGIFVMAAGSTGLRKAILPGYILMMATGIIVTFFI